ncbi:MAG: GNAT family N-acetyltransferase, partial [Candidatus Marinimicrobia bacterium]|nr:GNAT family N-acetyltransferase [Candidatus Neomarinimicrobiota bacterium]
MGNDIRIRAATKKDAAIISEHQILMAKETENTTLDSDVVLSGVEHLIEQPEYGFYIVAETEERVVGSILITYEWSDWHDGLYWWIQSVYVDTDFRRRGVYSQMYQYTRNLAEKEGIKAIQLYVYEQNTPAQKTYESLG